MQLTYARTRLWLGISGVGFWVTLSALFLVLYASNAIPLPQHGPFEAALKFGIGYVFLSIPFDLYGGFILPKAFGRSTQSLGAYLLEWFRGAFTHGLIYTLVAYGLLKLLFIDGALVSLGVLLAYLGAILLLLIVMQEVLACCLYGFGRLKATSETRAEVWHCHDIGFTGGIALLSNRNIMPAHWRENFTQTALEALERRRSWLSASASRINGILHAAWFVVFGAVLSYLVFLYTQLNPLDNGGYLGVLLVWVSLSTLWSFWGVLTLPTATQPATFKADEALRSLNREEAESLLYQLDALQDKEPSRSPGVQRIFHPIPSVETRLEALNTTDEDEAPPPAREAGNYHQARLALYFSWASLGLLSRAVHCNAGRPALWVFLPSDA